MVSLQGAKKRKKETLLCYVSDYTYFIKHKYSGQTNTIDQGLQMQWCLGSDWNEADFAYNSQYGVVF